MAGERIEGIPVNGVVNGRPVSYSRRRYGMQTYTWVWYHNGQSWIDLGDPWPVLQPKHAEITEAINRMEAA